MIKVTEIMKVIKKSETLNKKLKDIILQYEGGEIEFDTPTTYYLQKEGLQDLSIYIDKYFKYDWTLEVPIENGAVLITKDGFQTYGSPKSWTSHYITEQPKVVIHQATPKELQKYQYFAKKYNR